MADPKIHFTASAKPEARQSDDVVTTFKVDVNRTGKKETINGFAAEEFVVTLTVRRYLKQDRLVPSGFMGVLEALVGHASGSRSARGGSGSSGRRGSHNVAASDEFHSQGLRRVA